MLRKLRPRLTYANVASTLALVLAVGGGSAYAATKIGTSGIRQHAVTGAKLATNAVTASKVKNSALSGSDLRDSSVTTDDVRNGSLQAIDFAANQLPAGPKGDPATAIWAVVSEAGGLAAGKGVTATSGTGGDYLATIGQDITACSIVATLRGGENGNVVAAPSTTTPAQIAFTTRNGDTKAPRAFQFAVFC